MTQMSLVEVRTSSFLTCPGNGGLSVILLSVSTFVNTFGPTTLVSMTLH